MRQLWNDSLPEAGALPGSATADGRRVPQGPRAVPGLEGNWSDHLPSPGVFETRYNVSSYRLLAPGEWWPENTLQSVQLCRVPGKGPNTLQTRRRQEQREQEADALSAFIFVQEQAPQ